MSDLQSKFGGGLNMIQGSFEQGKQKLQKVQEVSQYNKVISEGLEKRAEIILELGESAYKKLRSGEISDEALTQISEEIISIDKTVFQARKMVESINEQSQQKNICPSCETELTPGDKFCGSCGYKIEEIEKVDIDEMVDCPHCEEKVPGNTVFCGCCGKRLTIE